MTLDTAFRRPQLGAPERSREAGFSLIEVVVAMFVLALMSIGLLPMILGSIQASHLNQELVSANSFANGQLDDARRLAAVTSTCSALTNWKATVASNPAEHGFVAVAGVGTCPTAFPSTVTVSVAVHPVADSTKTLANLTTKIIVTSA